MLLGELFVGKPGHLDVSYLSVCLCIINRRLVFLTDDKGLENILVAIVSEGCWMGRWIRGLKLG